MNGRSGTLLIKVSVRRGAGVEEVEAECFGCVAVHKTRKEPRQRLVEPWTLSHIPTGLLICTFADHERAFVVAQAMSPLLPADGSFDQQPSAESLQAALDYLQSIFPQRRYKGANGEQATS